MKILKTYARLFVSDIDASLPLFERLVGKLADLRSQVGAAQLAAVGDFLLIAGPAEVTDRYRDTIGPVIVDDIEDTVNILRAAGATVDRFSAPTGEGSYIRHPDGVKVEYLQYEPDTFNRVFSNGAAIDDRSI